MSELCKGSERDDGYLYLGTAYGIAKWASPPAFHRAKISNAVLCTRKRSVRHSVPHNLTIDYLLSIFPVDFICPVLGLKMTWGQRDSRNTSPSLDRIIPELGYVEGNVCWISLQANRLKNNATLHEMESIVAYMKNPPLHGQKETNRQ